jgi:hypothetical protein
MTSQQLGDLALEEHRAVMAVLIKNEISRPTQEQYDETLFRLSECMSCPVQNHSNDADTAKTRLHCRTGRQARALRYLQSLCLVVLVAEMKNLCTCDDCGIEAEDATNDGDSLCEDCVQNRAEAAWERHCEDFHDGGSTRFISLEQQQADARRLK